MLSLFRSGNHSFSLLSSGAKVLCRKALLSSTDSRAMDSVIQSLCPRISNSEFLFLLERVIYTLPSSSISMAIGSGAKESEAHKLSSSPSATLAVIVFRASFAISMRSVLSCSMVSGISIGFLFTHDAQKNNREAIPKRNFLKIVIVVWLNNILKVANNVDNQERN
ncbi:hypothetical protein MARI151_10402 [Maribacter litoralis]|uniref:Uncharacterized protein n=1 Tax=Maribacter litoralis TaxID=2059726 RepID=A0A653MNC3_9FLAO|nr:hypothetical protein MARI151_10402 [Maribacter litoralis]